MASVDEARAGLADAEAPFIDGARGSDGAGEDVPVYNPATGEQLTTLRGASPGDVDRAVAAARRSLQAGSWRGLSPSQREAALGRVAELLTERSAELGILESLDNGKTLAEGKGDVQGAAEAFRYYAGAARRIHGETIPVDSGDLVYTLREPVGVCGQIIPWNYPLLMAAWKVAPALACGCSVVLKPSEWTPLTALRLGEICHEAGVPAGVINVAPGLGHTTGDAMARHMGIDKLAFTGSTRTARALLKASGESNLKQLSLELGGKSPIVAMPDADLDAVVEAAFWGIFANKGEVCSASSRLLAHADVKDELVERLAQRAERMRVGDPMDPTTEMGSLVSQPQYDKVMDYIARGKAQGARLVAGGAAPKAAELRAGLFVRPTIFDQVEPHMDIAREEIFGPVLSVLSFDDEAQGIELANATPYGLVAAVFTSDVGRAHRMAAAVDAGVVWINRWNGFDNAAPFGGVKQSGWGRELGHHALELYTRVKCVWVQQP